MLLLIIVDPTLNVCRLKSLRVVGEFENVLLSCEIPPVINRYLTLSTKMA
jgi:hypothetical protein